MQRFLHHDQRRLRELLTELAEHGTAYRRRAYDLDDRLAAWLPIVYAYLRDRPRSASQAAAVDRLFNYLETARRGVHPEQLEKVRTGRREMLTTAAFSVINQASELLAGELEGVDQLLAAAEDILTNAILSARASDLLTDAHLTAAGTSLVGATNLWTIMTALPQLSHIVRKLLLTVSPQDAHLLIFSAAGQWQES
ncbi:MAG: hypothetical protein AAFZ52_10905 [Bacteroidota bacterium]